MPKKQMLKLTGLAVAVCSLIAITLPIPASASGWHWPRQKCSEETLQVKLTPEDTETYKLVGWLCWEGRLEGKTVQMLVSGFTYDHNYWDLPFKSDKYSYVDNMTSEGYATFNIDRIGVGKSDRPADPLKVTVPAEAYVAHQVVQALKNGEVGGTEFKKIIGVGHSMGAAIWIIAAGSYLDNAGVDGLILTDYLDKTDPDTQAALGESRYQANQDPKFADLGLADGYLTSKPDTRHLYYNPDFADPRVIETDEELKQTATFGELITLAEAQKPEYAANITIPTLIAVGQKDSLFCNETKPGLSCADEAAVLDREAALFTKNTCMEAFVMHHAGHDTNLHYNAPSLFWKAEKWSDQHVGQNSWHNPYKCS